MTSVTRFGLSVKADEVFFAWTSRDIDRMCAALDLPTNTVDRHHLLASLVMETYRRRKDPAMRSLCLEVAHLHMQELPVLIEALRLDHQLRYEWLAGSMEARRRNGRTVTELPPYDPSQAVPAIETMHQLEGLLKEAGRDSEVEAVWQRAQEAGYPHWPCGASDKVAA